MRTDSLKVMVDLTLKAHLKMEYPMVPGKAMVGSMPLED